MNPRTCILIGLTGGARWPSDPGDTATVAHTVTVDTDIDTIASITRSLY